MKIIEKYVCEYCGTVYSLKEDCEKCERFHIKPSMITVVKHEINSPFPCSMVVEMENGVSVIYERRKDGVLFDGRRQDAN